MTDEGEQRILLSQSSAGMVLSRPVHLPNRTALCPRGAPLSEGLVTKLMNLGIKRIWVCGQPLPVLEQDGYAQRIRRLRHGFARVRHIPLMAAIEQAIEKQIVRRS